MQRRTYILLPLVALLIACEKEITVDLPITEQSVVVEGNIENGQPPFVLLSRTQSYFAPTSTASLADVFITDGVVTVFDGVTTHTLSMICSGELSEEELQIAAEATGISIDLLRSVNICAWTVLDGSLVGEVGRTYQLNVQADGKTLTSTTTIPPIVALDSLWFRLALRDADDDSLGFIWARLSDPSDANNQYRWAAQRLNLGSDGEPKDDSFIAPLFSVFEDRYINGLSFDFNYNRGSQAYSEAEDDNNEEAGFFKRGDTVAVKFSSIDRNVFKFYDSYANNVASAGDLFSNPANVKSNITGGLGVWAGYAASFDTVICVP
ncbi:MAG: DUF4249 domain-containing protein [Flavobacteriales bacterium]